MPVASLHVGCGEKQEECGLKTDPLNCPRCHLAHLAKSRAVGLRGTAKWDVGLTYKDTRPIQH